MKSVSIVAARRELGRLAKEVEASREPVLLTLRGRVVASLSPEPRPKAASRRSTDALAPLRGTIRLNCTFDELEAAIDGMRRAWRREEPRARGRARRRG